MTKPETRSMVVVSFAHLTEVTCAMLVETDPQDWPVYGGRLFDGQATVIYCSDDYEIPTTHSELGFVLDWARGEGFDYVMFDRDAEEVEGLVTYQRREEAAPAAARTDRLLTGLETPCTREDRDAVHMGQLPGDDGRQIRDQNGLLVWTAKSAVVAEAMVEDHNQGHITLGEHLGMSKETRK